MKYLPPEPKIDIYNQGFGPDDFLGRAQTGRQLSELVEKIDDPFVLALDGVWGSGKSHFLKCWVGAHKLENDGSATTVYIDAFQHDFLEEPLIALTSAISSRLVGDPKSSKAWKVAKTAAARLWRPVARIGLAVGTAGLTEVGGVIADAALAATGAELEKQVDAFWRFEESKIAAMKQFNSALIELTMPDKVDDPPKKLVVVIDELDRCRPDYALSMLEVVKHFFAVPNVHFVIGVNLIELQNSVRARYGAGVDAATYLQKFITFSINLPELINGRGQPQAATIAYFEKMSAAMGLDACLVQDIQYFFQNYEKLRPKSLRVTQKILTHMSLLPLRQGKFSNFSWGYQRLICCLLLQKYVNPDFYTKSKSQELSMKDVAAAFGVRLNTAETEFEADPQFNGVWAYCVAPDEPTNDSYAREAWGHASRFTDRKQIIPSVIRDYLEVIKVMETKP